MPWMGFDIDLAAALLRIELPATMGIMMPLALAQ